MLPGSSSVLKLYACKFSHLTDNFALKTCYLFIFFGGGRESDFRWPEMHSELSIDCLYT